MLPVDAPRGAFGTSGAALQGLGKTVSNISDRIAAHVEQQQALDNKLAVDQATVDLAQSYGKMDEDFKNNNKGIAASENLSKLYTNIEAQRQGIASTLRSPAAQRDFAQASRIATLQFTQRAASFASTEKKDYQTKQIQGQISLLNQSATPENFDEVQGKVAEKWAILALPQFAGMSEDEYRATLAKERGTSAYNLTTSLTVSDPLKAQAFYDAHKDSMNAQQRAQAQQYITSRAEPVVVAGEVDSVIAGAAQDIVSGVATPQSRRAAIAGIESGGNYAAIGPRTSSGDHGYGKYQVMGANIPAWTKEVLGKAMTPKQFLADTAAQDKVFDVKFGQAAAKYGNEEDAASVWFTGRPRSAASASARDVTGTTGAGYVAKFRQALVADAGVGGSQVDLIESQVPAMQAELRTRMEAKYPGRPDLWDSAEAKLMSNVSRMRTANNIANGAAADRLLTAISDNNLKSVEALQGAYPTALQDWNQLSQSTRNSLSRQMNTLANAVTPEMYANGTRLKGMAADVQGDGQKEFLSTDLTKEDLGRSDLRSLTVLQSKLHSKAEKVEAANKLFTGVMGSPEIKGAMSELGLKPGGTPASRANYWHFSGGMQAQVEAWAKENPGKTPDSKAIRGMLATVAAEKTTSTHTQQFFGILPDKVTSTTTHAYTPSDYDATFATQFLRNVGLPPNAQNTAKFLAERDQIIQQAKERGYSPTPQDAYNILWRRYRGG